MAIIQALPLGKALGPNQIPNEILKILIKEILEGLIYRVSILLIVNILLRSLKESTIVRRTGFRGLVAYLGYLGVISNILKNLKNYLMKG